MSPPSKMRGAGIPVLAVVCRVGLPLLDTVHNWIGRRPQLGNKTWSSGKISRFDALLAGC